MRVWIDIAATGFASVGLHPLRSATSVACVLAVLVPYLAGIGISKGIEREAEISIQQGADLYVSGNRFGRPTSVPLASLSEIQAISGVEKVVPRIVGSLTLGREDLPAVVVGLPADALPASVRCVRGRLFRGQFELVIGSELARRLRLKPGDRIPPFYRNAQGERVCRIVGVFEADASLWQANLVFTSLETATAIFDCPGQATDLLVTCRPGYEGAVRAQILREITFPAATGQQPDRARVVSRRELEDVLPAGLLHREGVFNLHYLLALSVGILAILASSGLGLSERRREIGILKATGWQTDEVLFRALVENLTLSAVAAALALVIAFVWLEGFNGFGVASVFLYDVGMRPQIPIPFVLAPLPALLSLLLSFVAVATGSLYATWRAAIAPPRLAMRA